MSNPIQKSSQTRLPFFWIAFYSDKTCVVQYDFKTGKQTKFGELDQSKIVKFGLFPFSSDLAKKVGPIAVPSSNLPYFILELKPNQRLIGGIRREYQRFFDYSHCLRCGFEWQWMPNQPDGSIGDSELPRYGSSQFYYKEIQTNGKPVFEVICPKCGTKNDLKCPDCHEWWNKVADEETKNEPPEKRTYHLECPKCKRKYEQRTLTRVGHTVENVFLLGWQETQDGKNHKMIMFIKQDGSIILSDDFNAL
jgi:hypothetical protein